MRIIRRPGHRIPGVKIVQPQHLKERIGRRPEAWSVAALLTGANEQAVAFLHGIFGRIRRVSTEQELREHSQALTADGRGVSGARSLSRAKLRRRFRASRQCAVVSRLQAHRGPDNDFGSATAPAFDQSEARHTEATLTGLGLLKHPSAFLVELSPTRRHPAAHLGNFPHV